jgi:UDP-N-acetylmuramoylalanine--D-glutamate ligase
VKIKGEKVVVVGLGRTAVGLAKLLVREGAEPFVTERDKGDRIAPYAKALDELGVPYEIGKHTAKAYKGASVVIPSPGVPPDAAPVKKAVAKGCELVGEMEFASQFCPAPIIAVTGTNGKTTTTELIRALVARCGYGVVLAGNNDLPMSEAVLADPEPNFFVCEVSSYQLELAKTFRPWIGIMLNLSPDHLARHGTLEDYAEIKARLLQAQHGDEHAVLNYDDVRVRAMGFRSRGLKWYFSMKDRLFSGFWLDGDTIRFGDEAVALVSDVLLPGQHNLSNAMAALAALYAGGFPWARALEGLRSFKGVEHRIEHVATVHGVQYVNDSKSTNIDSLRVALESFDKPLILIAGGEGKGDDYGILASLVAQRVKQLIAIGQDAPLLEQAWGDNVPTTRANSMVTAVQAATDLAEEGDTVLLSPACASFDMFDNFEARGRAFKEAVAALTDEVNR